MSTFFSMGGYATYVWPAFGITAVVLTGLLVYTLKTLRARERALSAFESANVNDSHQEETA